MIFFYRIISI